ncbi:MAG: M14 family zinc carboxypeptidase [Gammaproteobacteria bacterium]
MTSSPINPASLLTELNQITDLISRSAGLAKLETLATIATEQGSLPVQAVIMGSDDPSVPAIGLFGGVHGVERIGCEVVLAYMHSLIEGLLWSPSLKEQLKHIRIVFIPLINPGGIVNNSRCNPNGVDLMRNAPIDADSRVAFLVGGHRISQHLPWFRGRKQDAMETESTALCEFVEQQLFNRPLSISLDCHSGYGRKDYIWFPYAGSRKPFPHAAEIQVLKQLFDRTYPNHTYYRIEPQSRHYITHGDLWDYLYKKSLTKTGVFLPLTLEMGSWQWVKKNPRQLFTFPSLFNPMLPHRHQRILRRHLVFFEFLIRAVHGYQNWLPDGDERESFNQIALQKWYTDDE